MSYDKKPGFGLYVHWPFCLKKCPYCDFNSHVRDRIDHDAFADSYLVELAHYRERVGKQRVTSIFFGGGTPSLMNPDVAGRVIDKAAKLFDLVPDIEITLEANPTSIEAGKFADFRKAGINRASVGIQALNDADLKFLGRQHSANEGRRAISIAAQTFDRFSFDLIYARPNQNVEVWKNELTEAISMAPTHLSLYQLTIEEGTQFHTLHARGDFKIPVDDDAAALFDVTDSLTKEAGLLRYEVSNHAKIGQESRHNLTYWRYGDYIGIGPGAHGRLTINGQKIGTRAHRAPEIWLDMVKNQGHGAHANEVIERKARAEEMMLMGLRLAEGVDLARLAEEAGVEIASVLDLDKIAQLQEQGFVVIDQDRLKATDEGIVRLDAILPMVFLR